MRQPIRLPELTPEAIQELDALYRTTRDVRLRTRSQMILLAAEQGLTAPAIARIMRVDENTVLLWLKRYVAEGINGLADKPRPGGPAKVTPVEDVRDHVKPGEFFCYADEFNVSWLPTLRAMLSPKGQQVMIPTPGQPNTHYGLGAVNYHAGETVVLVRRHKRRREIAELLQTLVDRGTIIWWLRVRSPSSTP